MRNQNELKISQKIPSELRIYKRKIEQIIKLEKKYWNEIEREKDHLKEVDQSFNRNLELIFPSNVSSRIYACTNGIVLLRYVISEIPNQFDVYYPSEPLESFLRHVPVPTKSELFLMPFPVGENNRIINSVINGIVIEWLCVSSFFYNDKESIMLLEDSLNDFKIHILGLIHNENFIPSDNKLKDEKNIIEYLKTTINDFEELLNNATREEEIQKFLKENTILIQPCTKKIPKQKLGEDFITDFVLVNTLDQGYKYTFVEIEKSDMPILTKNNEFRSEFKHAEQQTIDWDIWLQENAAYIKGKLEGFEYPPKYLIIGGRSKNMDEDERRYIRAFNRSRQNTEFLTYDDILKRAEELLKSLDKHVNS